MIYSEIYYYRIAVHFRDKKKPTYYKYHTGFLIYTYGNDCKEKIKKKITKYFKVKTDRKHLVKIKEITKERYEELPYWSLQRQILM